LTLRATRPGLGDQTIDDPSAAAQGTQAEGSRKLRQLGERYEIARLENLVLRLQFALDNTSQGVCLYDEAQTLIFCNRRYVEIYRLSPEEVQPGANLRRITELRVAARTGPTDTDEYLTLFTSANSGAGAPTRVTALQDGRHVRVTHQTTPSGGWLCIHEDVTDQQTDRSLAKERISLQTLIDWVPDYLWVKDTESRFVVVNKALAIDAGRSQASDVVGLNDFDFHSKDLAEQFRARELEILKSGQPMLDREEAIIGASGSCKWFLSTKIPLRNEDGEIFGLVGISRDITERKRAETLREGQARILEMIATMEPVSAVLDHLILLVESQLSGIFGSVLLLDDDGDRLRYGAAPNLAEPYVKAIDGMRIGPDAGSCGSAVYRRQSVIVSDIGSSPLWRDFRDLASPYGYRSCWSTPIISHQGEVLGAFAMYSRSVREPMPNEVSLIELATRIASIAIERKKAEDRIRHLANHDALTGLPNRALLEDRLIQAISYANRYGSSATVIFVDLDNFKLINDSLGHTAGDELLKRIAVRMVESVASTDTVVRLGGDEFVILLSDQPTSAELVAATLPRLKAAVAEPIEIAGHTLRVTASMGIASFPKDGSDAGALLANADAAMYRAKEGGRDNFQFYTPDLNKELQEKLLLQEELRNAVALREFVLHYQPQVDLRSGKVFAVEALIRWQHPRRGTLAPAVFIPIAEETGLIVSIGDWVLHEACRQCKAWLESGLPPLKMSVNVSARQFREKNLVGRVHAALLDAQLQPKLLELELTESLIMQDVEQAVTTMRQLQRLGVQISIDDFGTGYSSLRAESAQVVS
jgi:diguanylate cyclase (GGDEF)-like protein/PAS domain S-box-containing protein